LNPQAVPIPDLLHDLLLAAGPTGHEEAASAVWRKAASAFAEVTSDTLGTSFARVRAATEGAPTLALLGHIDEIGVVVTHIEGNGLLSFAALGGIDAELLVGQRVVLAGREGAVPGVIAPRVRRERGERSALKRDDLHIDIGAADRDDAATHVRPGDAGVWIGEPLELPNGRFASKALDDRLGAYAVLEAARRVAVGGGAAVDVVAIASVQEEIGHHGARAAAFALEPDFAVAVDVTYSTDVPGESTQKAGKIELGSGAAITLGPVANRRLSDLLVTAAEEDGIAHTIEVLSGRTHTDADDVHAGRGGVPTGILSIPVRYMHSPSEIAALDDLEAVIRLLVAFAGRLAPETDFVR
jgi:putative aminopeptidase FrvX